MVSRGWGEGLDQAMLVKGAYFHLRKKKSQSACKFNMTVLYT